MIMSVLNLIIPNHFPIDWKCVHYVVCWPRCGPHYLHSTQVLNVYYPETTARSLSATIGFLALYDDLQEEIYQQIISVVGQERDPVSTGPCPINLSVSRDR